MQVESFAAANRRGMFGFCEDTVSSLMLYFLKSVSQSSVFSPLEFTEEVSKVTSIMKTIVNLATELIHPLCFPEVTFSNYMKYCMVSTFHSLLQVINEDMVADFATYTESLILKNEKLQAVLHKIDSHHIVETVSNGLKWLMTESECDIDEPSDDSCSVSFIIFCFKTLLELLLCGKLIVLMKPEALIIHNNDLHPHYKKIYLKAQFHFSLPDAIHHMQRRM